MITVRDRRLSVLTIDSAERKERTLRIVHIEEQDQGLYRCVQGDLTLNEILLEVLGKYEAIDSWRTTTDLPRTDPDRSLFEKTSPSPTMFVCQARQDVSFSLSHQTRSTTCTFVRHASSVRRRTLDSVKRLIFIITRILIGISIGLWVRVCVHISISHCSVISHPSRVLLSVRLSTYFVSIRAMATIVQHENRKTAVHWSNTEVNYFSSRTSRACLSRFFMSSPSESMFSSAPYCCSFAWTSAVGSPWRPRRSLLVSCHRSSNAPARLACQWSIEARTSHNGYVINSKTRKRIDILSNLRVFDHGRFPSSLSI